MCSILKFLEEKSFSLGSDTGLEMDLDGNPLLLITFYQIDGMRNLQGNYWNYFGF